MTALAEKTCVPCRGGVPRLDSEEARRMIEETPGWSLNDDATRIHRRFGFKTFLQALDFANRVGALAEEEGHHPDITFGWGYCDVTFQTHKIKGLHENDFIMAAKVDELAGMSSGQGIGAGQGAG